MSTRSARAAALLLGCLLLLAPPLGVATLPPAAAGPAVAGEVATRPPAPVRPPAIHARAALLADEATGQVLLARRASEPRPMASTTKVMTALLVLESLDLDQRVTVGARPPRVGGSSVALREGERLTVRQLLLALLVKSANGAAVALAEAVDGSEKAFVRHMNRRAAELGLADTRYVTPHGLDQPGHHTSPRDLARLWEEAMRRPAFRKLVATEKAVLPAPGGERHLETTVTLLHTYRWTEGGKTGYTDEAGRCLVASASRGGRRLVAVAFGSDDAMADVRALFEYGFDAFLRARVVSAGETLAAGGWTWRAAEDVDALVRRDRLAALTLEPPTGSGLTGSGWLRAGDRRIAPVELARVGPTTVTTAPDPEPVPAGTAAEVLDGSLARAGPAPRG